jgi:predicted GNAT family N-acyltransferase
VRIVEAGPEDLSICLAIRRAVFIEGQNVSEADEIDGLDPECTHFLAFEDDEPAGTARLRITPDGHAKVERVAVLERFRGRSLGDGLMAALEACAAELGHEVATLGAQVQVIPFYEKRGWIAEGPVFLDADIPHRKMTKRLRPHKKPK